MVYVSLHETRGVLKILLVVRIEQPIKRAECRELEEPSPYCTITVQEYIAREGSRTARQSHSTRPLMHDVTDA